MQNDPAAAIRELRIALTASAKKQAADRHNARDVFWKKVSSGLPIEWAAIEASGGRAGLDLGLESLLVQSTTQRRFKLSQNAMAGIAADAESVALSGNRLGEDIALATVALSVADDQAIGDAAKAALDAAAALQKSLNEVNLAVAKLNDILPKQKGGRGQLSDQVSGGHSETFKLFAKVASRVWREAGLSIGGNNSTDQNYSTFLDAVHLELFGEPIRGRGALLADARDTWPKPRFR